MPEPTDSQIAQTLAASCRTDLLEPSDTLQLSGEFDATSARLLGSSLAERAPGSEIHLDFSRVNGFSDRGVAALAAILGELGRGPQVVFHGLRQHQIRLFRYFGLDVERPVVPGGEAHPALLQ
ncbi:MAG: STAS domain-containing protein [Deltaproteobacteria bacterium]